MKYLNPLLLSIVLLFTPTAFAQTSQSLNQQLFNGIVKKQNAVALKAIQQGANVNLKTQKGVPLLNYAIFNGQTEIVEAMIAKGVNPHLRDPNGLSAIIVAASGGKLQIVEMLTDKNLGVYANLSTNTKFNRRANINDVSLKGNNALMQAAANGHTNVVRALLSKNANLDTQNTLGFSALMSATNKGYLEIVKLLVNGGANKNLRNKRGMTAMDIASTRKFAAIQRALRSAPTVSKPQGEPAAGPASNLVSSNLNQQLFNAIVKRQPENAVEAIAKGAEVNLKTRKGVPLLNIATFNGQTQVVKAMIDKGVNPHIKDPKGETAIIVAAAKGHLPIVKLLTDSKLGIYSAITKNGQVKFNRRANVNDQNLKGETASMWAIVGNHSEIIEVLLANDANLNAQNANGISVLMYAVAFNRLPLVKLLVEKGANVNAVTESGVKAIDMARAKKYTAIVNVLSRARATKYVSKPSPKTNTAAKPLAPCPRNRAETTDFSLNGWLKTGFKVNRGDRLTFIASGRVSLGIIAGSTNPNGINDFKGYNLVRNNNWYHGVLIARIKQSGNNDSWYKIGSRGEIVSRANGTLELAVNDRDNRNNGGQFDVVVRVCRAR